jgi:TonB family protein
MMHLDPSHKPLAGIPGVVLALIPVVVFLAVLPFWRQSSTEPPPLKAHASTPARVDSLPATVASVEAPVVQPRAEQNLPRKPAVAAVKITGNERVLYSIRWLSNGARRKLSGSLPKYPVGMNDNAMVRIEMVVASSGVVRSARMLTPPHPHCDEPSLREVRQWKFEPLQVRHKNPDQRCAVTISFFKK